MEDKEVVVAVAEVVDEAVADQAEVVVVVAREDGMMMIEGCCSKKDMTPTTMMIQSKEAVAVVEVEVACVVDEDQVDEVAKAVAEDGPDDKLSPQWSATPQESSFLQAKVADVTAGLRPTTRSSSNLLVLRTSTPGLLTPLSKRMLLKLLMRFSSWLRRRSRICQTKTQEGSLLVVFLKDLLCP